MDWRVVRRTDRRFTTNCWLRQRTGLLVVAWQRFKTTILFNYMVLEFSIYHNWFQLFCDLWSRLPTPTSTKDRQRCENILESIKTLKNSHGSRDTIAPREVSHRMERPPFLWHVLRYFSFWHMVFACHDSRSIMNGRSTDFQNDSLKFEMVDKNGHIVVDLSHLFLHRFEIIKIKNWSHQSTRAKPEAKPQFVSRS